MCVPSRNIVKVTLGPGQHPPPTFFYHYSVQLHPTNAFPDHCDHPIISVADFWDHWRLLGCSTDLLGKMNHLLSILCTDFETDSTVWLKKKWQFEQIVHPKFQRRLRWVNILSEMVIFLRFCPNCVRGCFRAKFPLQKHLAVSHDD